MINYLYVVKIIKKNLCRLSMYKVMSLKVIIFLEVILVKIMYYKFYCCIECGIGL